MDTSNEELRGQGSPLMELRSEEWAAGLSQSVWPLSLWVRAAPCPLEPESPGNKLRAMVLDDQVTVHCALACPGLEGPLYPLALNKSRLIDWRTPLPNDFL